MLIHVIAHPRMVPCHVLVLPACSIQHTKSYEIRLLQASTTCLQQMWEDAGITWEWTWYSGTVHAFTQPDLVGENASPVSPTCFELHLHVSTTTPLHNVSCHKRHALVELTYLRRLCSAVQTAFT